MATITELESTYADANIRADFWVSEAANTQRMFNALRLDQKQRADLLLKVDGDVTRYGDLKNLVKAVLHSDRNSNFHAGLAIADAGPSEVPANPVYVALPTPSPPPFRLHLLHQ